MSRSSGRLAFQGIVAVAMVCASVTVASAAKLGLEVHITGIDSLEGEIVIAVFNTEDSFDDRSDPVAIAYLPVDAETLSWSTELAVPSAYAIAVYHDVNSNRELDMRRLGGPKEPYGFSNNVRGVFGPPGFENALIRIGSESLSLEIEVR